MFGHFRHSRRSSTSSNLSCDDHAQPSTGATSPSMLNSASRQSSPCCPAPTCSGLTAEKMRQLWKCMLVLQTRYGCYHSARMDLAMEAGDDGVNYMPNRFIIDTLNNSVVDLLPEEGWQLLDQCLHADAVNSKSCSS